MGLNWRRHKVFPKNLLTKKSFQWNEKLFTKDNQKKLELEQLSNLQAYAGFY